jgi:hypothetical protein
MDMLIFKKKLLAFTMMILALFFMQRVSAEDERQNHPRNQLIVTEMQRLGLVIPAPNAYTQQTPPDFIQKQTEHFKSIAGESSSRVKSNQVTLEVSSMPQNRDGVFHRSWIWIVRQWNHLLSFFHVSSTSAVIEKLSYCAAISASQADFIRQIGNDETILAPLDHGAYAYAKTAFDIGERAGMTHDRLIEINKDNSRRVYKDVLNHDFLSGEILPKKNNECLTLVKSDLDILQSWRRFYNQ